MFNKVITLGLMTIMLAIMVVPVSASNGIQVGIVGGRALAMGNNFRGLADDWSALFFNPAGLTQLSDKWTIGFSNGLVMPRGDYTANVYPQNMLPFSGIHTEEVECSRQTFYIPSLSIAYKHSDKITLGLGVYAPFGLGSEWDLIDLPESYGNNTGISKDKENYGECQVIHIQPTFAYKFSEKFSIGLGLSYIYGKLDMDVVKLSYNPAIAYWTHLVDGLAQRGIILPPLTPDQYRMAVENNLSVCGHGFGANLGLHFKASDKFSMGLSMRYHTDLKLYGDNTQILIRHGDAAKYTTLHGSPSSFFANALDPTGQSTKQAIMDLFSGTNKTTLSDASSDVPLPMTVGLGFAYKPTDKWTFTTDFSWTNWEVWDEIEIEMESDLLDNMVLKQDWKSTFEMGLGIEFLATQMLAIRCGYYTVDTPIPAATMNPTIPDPSRRHVMCGGFGFNFGNVNINLAGEYLLFQETTIDTYEFDPLTGIADNYAGIYNFTAYTITASAQIALN